MKHKLEKFLPIAAAVAGLSKDPDRKVGAVALNDDGMILAVGYNGFPRGINDDRTRLENRSVKLALTSHGEANVVAQAAYAGHSLKGSTVVIHGKYPCSSCTKLLIQAGVKRIITPPPDPNSSWFDDSKFSTDMLAEVGVEVIEAPHASNGSKP